MKRPARITAAVVLIAASIPLSLLGAFAILYDGETGEDETHVLLGGEEVDARLFGVVMLIIALLAVVGGVTLLRHHGRSR